MHTSKASRDGRQHVPCRVVPFGGRWYIWSPLHVPNGAPGSLGGRVVIGHLTGGEGAGVGETAGGPLRRAGRTLWSYSAARGGMVFVGASIAVGLSNFVFHVVLSRLLGPSGYGALGALLNVTAVLTIPLAAVQVTVAQSVARRPDPSDAPPLGRLLRMSALAALIGVGVWLAATPTIDRFFHLHTPGATIVLGLWLIPTLPAAVMEGVLLGQRRFRVVGIGQLLGGGLARLAAGVVLVELGMGVLGGVFATVFAGLVILAVYSAALRSTLGRRGRFVPRAGDAMLSVTSLGGAALLTSIDVWLARHFLSAESAGLFTAAATAGRIALFLPGAITLVYFPRLAASGGRGSEARKVLARATGLVAGVGFAIAGLVALFAGLAVSVLFGPAFAHASVAVGTVATADAAIGVASCLIYYHVARRSPLALAAWPTCVVALGLAAAFHGSIEVLALDMLTASGALVIGLGIPTLLVALRSLADDSPSIPRQAMLLDEATLDVTLVVPFYNVGAERLADHLARVCDTLATTGVAFEVLPVSDGSTDGSEHALTRLPPEVVRPIVWADNRGKGEALRIGLSRGRGSYLGFIDGDGDIPADVLTGFVDLVRRERPEMVVGSKRHPEASVVYPPLRRLYSTSYQLLTAVLFGLRVRDTQTGIKLVRRDVVAEVLPRMLEKRFAFDLELLAVAHRLGYRQVAELPVTIVERFTSTVSPGAVWRMLQDTLATFWRLRVLRFYDPPLEEPERFDREPTRQVVAPAGASFGLAMEGAAEAIAPAPVPLVTAMPARSGATLSATDRRTALHVGDLSEWLHSGARLRILICSWRDLSHPQAGGAEVYTHRVARAWVAQGHRVTWLAAAASGRPSIEVVDGITVIRRGGRHSVYRQARLFYERQGRGRFDLVVDEVNTRPFEAARWAGDAPVVALVHQVAREVWFHELPWPVAALGRFFLEPRWLRRLRRVPVMTVSESSSHSLRRFGIDDITVVPEGVDPVDPPSVEREDVPTLIFVGRLARNKRPDHAVEAFRLLRRRLPEAKLWIIGTGPMASELLRQAPAGVELLGRLSDADKRLRLARAHCLVATSVREGWGLTVTEAAQVGTPAVAYDVGGLRDSVRASGGLLVAPRPQALADALAECLPEWLAHGVPRVEPGGVLPWSAVAEELLDRAGERISARRRAAAAGEDVAVAWRRALAPVAALCDRRAWTVVGIAALVAVAAASEAGAATWTGVLGEIALGSLALAAVGTWADAALFPPPRATASPVPPDTRIARTSRAAPVDRGHGRQRRRPLLWQSGWIPMLVVGAVGALAAQTWFGHGAVGVGDALPYVGSAWTSQLALAFSPGAKGAGDALLAVFQLPISATGTALHALGGSAVLDQRLWLTVLFAAVGMAMTGLLLALGVGAVAAMVGGLVYSFSPYVVAMSGLSIAYLSAMVLLPAIVAWVLVEGRSDRLAPSRLVWLVPGAMLLGQVAASPPLLLVCLAGAVGAVLVVGWLHGRHSFLTALRRTGIGAGLLVVASAYWAVPFALQLASTSMVSVAARRHWHVVARATLANGFWLNNAWDWGDHLLYPYDIDFHHFPLVLWRYALPIAAFASFGVVGLQEHAADARERLRALAVAGAVALVVVMLSTGHQGPGAALFGLITALPYGWLLEDPGRFLFVAGAAYAVMVAIVIDQVLLGQPRRSDPDQVRHNLKFASARLGPAAVAAVMVVALITPAFPLVSGSMTHLSSRAQATSVHPATVSSRRSDPRSGYRRTVGRTFSTFQQERR